MSIKLMIPDGNGNLKPALAKGTGLVTLGATSGYAGWVSPAVGPSIVWKMPLADAAGYLHSDGAGNTSWGAVTVPSGASPSASVGLSAVNGSAATFLRSDGAPALDQTIAPTWSSQHNFTGGVFVTGQVLELQSGAIARFNSASQTQILLNSAGSHFGTIQSESGSVSTFSLGYTSTPSATLGTKVLSWDDTGRVVLTNNNITTTSADGIVQQNTTAATVSVQNQYSPCDHDIAHVWNTSGAPADNYAEFLRQVRTTAGGVPTASMVWSSRISAAGSGSFTDVMTLTTSGKLTVLSGIASSGGNVSGFNLVATGNFIGWNGSSQMSASADGRIVLNNAAINNFDRLQFGGTTSSFPAIKRNAAALNFRLADDSGDCNITAAGITLSGLPRFNGTNTTGAGTAALGANSPAVTNTAPYTWIQATSSDGSTVYIPCWK